MRRIEPSARLTALRGSIAALAALGAVAGSGVSLAVSAGAATADTATGSAYGISVTGPTSPVVPPTPSVTLPASGAAQSSNLLTLPTHTVVTSATATVRTAATNVGTAAEQVTSSATVDNLASLAAIRATTVMSSCTADATGATGSVNVANLTLGGMPETVPTSTATFVLPALIPGVTIEANHEVQSTTAGSVSITVDGLFVQLATGAGATVVVGQSVCAVQGPGIFEPPTATGVSPSTGATNGGTPVTITGTNFYGPASVTFGGTPATDVTVVSPSEITADSPAENAGSVPVTVKTPAGGPVTTRVPEPGANRHGYPVSTKP